MNSYTLNLAFDRGLHGRTFATADELRVPGYDAAYVRGQNTATITAARDALFTWCHTGRMSQAKFEVINLRTACVSAMRDLCGVTLPEVAK